MNLFDSFAAGLPLSDFLAKYGSGADGAKGRRRAEQTRLTDAQKQLLGKFTRRTNVLVLAGAWCGDARPNARSSRRFRPRRLSS